MSKKQCQAETKSGDVCKAAANENGFCFTHDASRGRERAEARRKGGLNILNSLAASKTIENLITKYFKGWHHS